MKGSDMNFKRKRKKKFDYKRIIIFQIISHNIYAQIKEYILKKNWKENQFKKFRSYKIT